MDGNEVLIFKEKDGKLITAVPNSKGSNIINREFLRRGNFAYNLNSYDFIKAAGLLIYFPIATVACKMFIPIFVYKPVVFLSKIFRNVQWLQNIEKNLTLLCKPKTARPFRALVAIVAHVAIGILALMPLFSNFFNKINGDLERWVNGCSTTDVKEKSIMKRLRESFYIAPCQQPLFYIESFFYTESSARELNYCDLQDTNLNILKVVAREFKFVSKFPSSLKNIRDNIFSKRS